MSAASRPESPALFALLRRVSFFRYVDDATISAVALMVQPARYAAGATIFLEGEPCPGMYIVEEGAVKIIRMSLEGREHILFLAGPGDSFNDVPVVDGGPNPATAVAHSDVVLWRLDRPSLRDLVNRHPDMAWALLADLGGRARYLVGLVQDMVLRTVKGRLARLLLEEAEAAEAGVVQRLLTQEEMAARLGTVREMVGRTLRGLAAEGIIEFDRHRIVILDRERLRREVDA